MSENQEVPTGKDYGFVLVARQGRNDVYYGCREDGVFCWVGHLSNAYVVQVPGGLPKLSEIHSHMITKDITAIWKCQIRLYNIEQLDIEKHPVRDPKALRNSALAKLTAEEIEALGYNPDDYEEAPSWE